MGHALCDLGIWSIPVLTFNISEMENFPFYNNHYVFLRACGADFTEEINPRLAKPGIILGMGSANARRHYIVMCLIGWTHAENNPCKLPLKCNGGSANLR